MPSSALRFRFVPSDSLPRLAWGAVVRRGDPTVEVHHGPWVETGEGFFAEGAWDRPFGVADLSLATACMGSGGELRDGGVVFAGPSHTLERLHWLRRGDRLFVSNSLAFTLALADDALDPAYPGYAADLTSFTRGIRDCVDRLPTRDGHELRLAYYANLVVGADLSVTRRDKAAPAPFDDYASYVGMLRGALRALHANATDPRRRVRYEPLSSVSSGYDSPACAVLALEIGCRESVTFRNAREKFVDTDDSGTEIGRILGLRVHEFDRTDYLRLADGPEADFLAAGTGGEEVVFAALRDLLPGRMFITGYIGDSAWNVNSATPNAVFWRASGGGASFAEFRLRYGFVHCPLPVVGHVHCERTVAIARMPEMAPWSIGGSYDRPIPRRIAEEAGIPRGLFGQDKKAVTQGLTNARQHERVMTPASYRDFAAFARGLPRPMAGLARLKFDAMRLAHWVDTRIVWRRQAAAARAGRPYVPRRHVADRYRRRPLKGDFTFPWAVDRLQARYRDGLRASAADAPAAAELGAAR